MIVLVKDVGQRTRDWRAHQCALAWANIPEIDLDKMVITQGRPMTPTVSEQYHLRPRARDRPVASISLSTNDRPFRYVQVTDAAGRHMLDARVATGHNKGSDAVVRDCALRPMLSLKCSELDGGEGPGTDTSLPQWLEQFSGLQFSAEAREGSATLTKLIPVARAVREIVCERN